MLVHHLLELATRHDPDALAVIEPGATATYRQLQTLSNRFAMACRTNRVRPGDRVVIAIENSIAFVAAYFGVLKAGGVAVPMPAGVRNDRLPGAVRSCAPALCIVNAPTARTLRANPTLACGAILEVGSDRLPDGRVDGQTDWSASDAALAAIIFTSGSSGQPRGVMLTHRNIVANTRSIVAYLGLTDADRVMCVLPLHYVYALSLLHTHVMVGGSIVLDNRFAYPNVVLHAMRLYRVTGFAGVPSTFAVLLRRSELRTLRFPDLRYVTQAGGPMPSAHIREWLAHGPPAPFYVMYGATEAAARLAYLPAADLERKLGSIGRAIPGVEIDIVTDEGRKARPMELGELVARGENISPGYWRDSEETRARFGADGYRTGDLGYADADGFIYLVGRRGDILKIGGHRVGAREIEDMLCRHPAVHEAAVVGVPDAVLGEVPVAFVSLDTTAPVPVEGGIRRFCAANAPPYKTPSRVVFLSELPKNPAGKIDKGSLRLQAQSLGQTGDTHDRGNGPAVHRQQLSLR